MTKAVIKDDSLAKLVKRAKQGDQSAQRAVFDLFERFLIKYRALLKTGTVDLGFRDLRRFLCLYIDSDQLRNAVKSGRLNKITANLLSNRVSDMQAQYGGLTTEDIDSIIDVTFFQCLLNIYDPKGKVKNRLAQDHGLVYDELPAAQRRKWDKEYPEVGFEGFMSNYFFYQLKKNLENETKGVVAGVGWCETRDVSDSSSETTDNSGWDDIDFLSGLEIKLDHDWVEGKTATWPFSELTKQERWLIKMRYEDDMFSCDIADEVGSSASVIRTRIKDLRHKLERMLDAEAPNWRDRWSDETQSEWSRGGTEIIRKKKT